jgi:hypothetical protein
VIEPRPRAVKWWLMMVWHAYWTMNFEFRICDGQMDGGLTDVFLLAFFAATATRVFTAVDRSSSTPSLLSLTIEWKQNPPCKDSLFCHHLRKKKGTFEKRRIGVTPAKKLKASRKHNSVLVSTTTTTTTPWNLRHHLSNGNLTLPHHSKISPSSGNRLNLTMVNSSTQ